MNNFNINKRVNPKGLKRNEYDVIIIGAGIGGLTCGCYLAKAGLKVLIVEQHHKPGGYCTSFKRKGFTFDATTHYLGSLREDGPLRKIFNELELDSKINIVRFDPSNVLLCPEFKIRIRSNLDHTIHEFQEHFRDEAENIESFFKFISNAGFATLFTQLRNKSFENLLDMYFKDNRLKSILGVLLLNIGSPPSRASALMSAIFYKEFIIDGGYYPLGGIQTFPNALVDKFKEWGGEILLGEEVRKIVVSGMAVEGIILNNDCLFSSKSVVSNCDSTNTFLKLIGEECLPSEFVTKLNNLEITPSAFIVYLGLDRSYSNLLEDRCSWWCSNGNEYNVEKYFLDLNRKDKPYLDDFVFCVFPSSHDLSLVPPGGEIVILIVPAKMTDSSFWQDSKYCLADEVINRAGKFIPDLTNSIVIKEIATPLTLRRYTSNKDGASYGWASITTQTNRDTMPPTTFIKGLYQAGHWTTQGAGQGGVSTVAYCGQQVAKLMIKI